jgi:protein-S-isoprenylcysteine O-methyltransferase Ste14
MAFIVVRAAAYAALFVSLVLILLPRWVVRAAGGALQQPTPPTMTMGGLVFLAGAALVVACVATFAVIGKGTPAPFDPPRRLVVRGPYKYVRNPMYVGAFTALIGAAIYCRSLLLALFALGFLLVTHLFVTLYEEPILSRKFGDDYLAYRASVPRWLPSLSARGHSAPNEPLPPWLS